VLRRFVVPAESALAELVAARLSTLDLVVIMGNWLHFGEHTCGRARGRHRWIDAPIAAGEGSTESAIAG
jgi:hypothetical protein